VLSEAAVEIEAAPTWAPESKGEAQADWQSVDRALRTIARRRVTLDADEAHWLREAEALQIWRPLGMVSALDYLERVLGYGPRVAQDRLRVARALGTLPLLTAALAHGELPFSAVRELTRVATPGTEAAWREAATGKNLRQIEELVADHRPGDRPDDPPDPEARVRVVRFELSAETFALLRQARAVLDDEHGSHLPDDQFVATLCNAVLARRRAHVAPTSRSAVSAAPASRHAHRAHPSLAPQSSAGVGGLIGIAPNSSAPTWALERLSPLAVATLAEACKPHGRS
jgi:hypothetical protein